MTVLYLIAYHVLACLWIFIGRFNYESKSNWIVMSGYADLDDNELYVIAFYYTVTTTVTVGYGDITPKNLGERIFCILLMLIGIISFSFLQGTLTSIIQQSDNEQSILDEKLAIYDSWKSNLKINDRLDKIISRVIKYNHFYKPDNIDWLMQELP